MRLDSRGSFSPVLRALFQLISLSNVFSSLCFLSHNPFSITLSFPLSLSPALFHLLFFSLRYFSLCFQHISDPCCLIPKILLWVKSACFSPLGFSPDLSDYVLPQFFLFVVSTVYFVLGHIFISSLKFFFFLIYVFGWMYLFASTSSISDR